MGRTVESLLTGNDAPLSSLEQTQWMAFYQLEPWGYHVDCHHTGQIASAIFRAHGGRSKPSDFVPKDPVKQTVGEQIAALRALTDGNG